MKWQAPSKTRGRQAGAIQALRDRLTISGDCRLNTVTLVPWTTDAQVRKTAWLPLMTRVGIPYRNPYQIRHTYASTQLTAGANPWYVAQHLGHEDVEMVFRTYGKFIREDYQKPKAELRLVSEE